MSRIVLDAESFRALASDTRLQILKALDGRPLTVSELSRLLELNKATVFEHLKQLMAADLAKKEEGQGRKWVYYRLTWKGRNVLHPENVQIFLLLSLAALGGGAFVLQAFRVLRMALAGTSASETPEVSPASGPEKNAAAQSSAPPSGGSSPSGSGPGDDANQPPGTDGQGSGGFDWLHSYQVWLLGLLLVAVLLCFLVWWALGRESRAERRRVRERLRTLPADVNRDEERSV